jgi:hypothetical protein
VLLIAGGRCSGMPTSGSVCSPPGLASKSARLPAPLKPRRDYCEDMRRSLAHKPAPESPP